jgi:adenylate kinase family enzyme
MISAMLPQANRRTTALYQRIVVVGNAGAGKTTAARQIAARLGLPHVELDALHWDAGWTEAPTPVFRARVERALAGPAWVTDGNYSSARDLIWPRAELIVWLDFGLPVILWRLLRRSLRRGLLREELWNGNRERLRDQFFNRESLFIYAVQTHHRRQAGFAALLARPEHAHLALARLRTPAAARRWLAVLPSFSGI